MNPTDKRGDVYRPHVDGRLLAVSFITVGELFFGAYKKNWGISRLEDLKERLSRFTIVPYDFEVCLAYAHLKAEIQGAGLVVAPNDLWIAACAVRHSIPLISNNRSDFEKVPALILISEAPICKEIQSQAQLPLVGDETTSSET